jgi:hypothetical protein
MKSRGGGSIAVIIGALGAIIIGIGVILLVFDAARAWNRGYWESTSLLDLRRLPGIAVLAQNDLVSWIEHPRALRGVHRGLLEVLDITPAWLFFLLVGALIVWRAAK